MRLAVILLCAFCAACAPRFPNQAPDPIVDPRTIKDEERYKADLADCRVLSDKAGTTLEGAGQGGALGAAGGAVVGAGLAAVISPGAALAGAGAGAITGGAMGAGTGGALNYIRQRSVMMNCMIGRGYRPLG